MAEPTSGRRTRPRPVFISTPKAEQPFALASAIDDDSEDSHIVPSSSWIVVEPGDAPASPPTNPFLTPPLPVIANNFSHRTASISGSLVRGGSGYFTSRPVADRTSTGLRTRDALTAPGVRPASFSRRTSMPPPKIERPRSRLIVPGTVLEKPWLEEVARDEQGRKAARDFSRAVTYAVLLLGIAAGAVKCYFGWKSMLILEDGLCLVMDENFVSEETVFGPSGKWMHEVEVGGFGNGQFDMTTSSRNNSYIKNGRLYITPTLTTNHLGPNILDTTFNATDCTFNATALSGWEPEESFANCGVVSNSSTGVVVPPVMSARLTTRRSASIRFGKVEVRAKMPKGDWLWPAIWMLPTNNVYGAWPRSGEIDITEGRGNGPKYPAQGSNWVRGALNWGPLPFLNGVHKTYGSWSRRPNSGYNEDFHTYTLEWTEKFLRISVDTRLKYMLYTTFGEKKRFWDRGDFPSVVRNGTDWIALRDPWVNGTAAAPFDQDFFLILNVAVGGTSGWFKDNAGRKPWLDQSKTAMREFSRAQSQWYPTWPKNFEDRSMIVDYVRMWQKCDSKPGTKRSPDASRA